MVVKNALVKKILNCSWAAVARLRENETWPFIETGVYALKKGYTLDMLNEDVQERDLFITDEDIAKELGFKNIKLLTEKSIQAKDDERRRYAFKIKYLQLFGAIATLNGLNHSYISKKVKDSKNESDAEIGYELPSCFEKEKLDGKAIGAVLDCAPETVSRLKASNKQVFEIMKLGITCYLKRAQLRLLTREINIKSIMAGKNSDISKRVIELLGYEDKKDLKHEKSSKEEVFYNYRFRTKYFQIFGALATLAGADGSNLQELQLTGEDREDMKKLPEL